jgi:hypothetical protein
MMRLLEPSFGGGDFLLPIIGRLLAAWRAVGAVGSALEALGDAIFAVELHRNTYRTTRAAVVSFLQGEGVATDAAQGLAADGCSGRFPDGSDQGRFDFVVGNPPMCGRS